MMPESNPICFRDYRPSDREWVATANIRHYTTVEGFDSSFARAVSSTLDLLSAKREDDTSRSLIVETRESRQPVGCAFFSAENSKIGRIRLFYLDKAYRGLGIGRCMIERLIGHAEAQGFAKICVSTFDRHKAACDLYRALGFRGHTRAPAIVFGQSMRQIDFEKRLHGHAR